MTGDLVRTVAFAFRRKGEAAMAGGDLRLLLAYDLRWFAPEDAKRVVARAVEVGILHEQDGVLSPAFDPARVEVPVNFRPTVAVLDEEVGPLPEPAPPAAAPAPAAPAAPSPAPARDEAFEKAAEDERRRRGGLVSIDVARLIVRRRQGADVADDAAALEAALLRKRG